ncbi:MAG: hypothetical protein J2P57_12375, partial [Acidimicrobiaceae bacterium]|nr:hypothetical protein [Acidimicrobiaceae bacterium]
MPGTDELWGGSLVSVAFDPVSWVLQLGVEVVENEERGRYQLLLDGVTEWHVARDTPLPWNHAELTEVHVT